METLELSFAHGEPGRLACEVAGAVTCQKLEDGVYFTPEEAGTLYVLLAVGSEEPWQVAVAREQGYTVEVQYGDSLALPPPDPQTASTTSRRRSSS